MVKAELQRWDIDELYAFFKSTYPYRDLPRRHFEILLEMLAGRYADTRLRELKSRVSLDRIDNAIQAHSATAYLLYISGGTIPDRGYFDLRLQDTRAKIGELDEEFVWERSIGDTFTLGSQLWRIRNITHNDVEVAPARTTPDIIPFLKAEEQNRDFHFSERISLFLEHADTRLDSAEFRSEVMISKRYGRRLDILTGPADAHLPEYFSLFKELLSREFKPAHKISVEKINGEPALRSPYAQSLKQFGFRSARNALELWKEY